MELNPTPVMNLTLFPAGGTSSLTSEVTITKKSEQNDPVAPVVVPSGLRPAFALQGNSAHLSQEGHSGPSLSQEPLSQVGFWKLESQGPSFLGRVKPQDKVSSVLFQQTLQRQSICKRKVSITD